MNLAFNIQHFTLEIEYQHSELELRVSSSGTKQTFPYPFFNLNLQLEESEKQSLYLEVLKNKEVLGTAQMPLDEFSVTDYIERWLILVPADSSSSPEQSPKRSSVTVGKMKVSVILEKPEQVNCENCEGASEKISEESDREPDNFLVEMARLLGHSEEHLEDLDVQEIALNVEKLQLGSGDIKGKDAEHVRNLILGLNDKLKGYNVLQAKLAESRKFAQECLKAREYMQKQLEKSNYKIETLKKQTKEMHSNTSQEREKESRTLRETKNQLMETQQQLDTTTSQKEQLESENSNLKNQLQNQEEMSQMIKSLQNQISQGDQARSNFRNELRQQVEAFEQQKQALENEIQRLKSDNQTLTQKDETLENQLKQQKDTNNSQKAQISKLEAECSRVKAQVGSYQETETRNQHLQGLVDKLQEDTVSLNQEIKNTNTHFSYQIENLTKENENLQTELKKTKAQKTELDKFVTQLTIQIKQLSFENKEQISKIASLEQKISNDKELYSVKEELADISRNNAELQNQAYKDIDFMSHFCLNQAEQTLNNQRNIHHLKEYIQDKENEIHVLREMVSELQKSRGVYVAVKDDPVDQAISQYVNTRSVQIPFVREDAGIYLFGSKRVYIKIENNKVIVRVGGGYISIDEFIETYTPIEMEKYQNKKSQLTESKKRSLLTTLGTQLVSQKLKSSNPSEMSPSKAKRIVKEAFFGANTNFSNPYGTANRESTKKRLSASPDKMSRSSSKKQSLHSSFF